MQELLDRPVGAMLAGLAEAIRSLGIKSIEQLVWTGRDGPPLGTFWPEEWQRLLSWYGLFAVVAVTPGLVHLIVAYFGLKTAVGGADPRVRQQLYQLFPGFLAMVLMVLLAPLALQELLRLNAWLAELVGLKLGGDVAYFRNPASLPADRVQSYTLYGLMQLVLVGVELSLNFLYVIRKVVIGASFVLLPLAGWVFVFRNTHTPLLLLVSEMVSNAFMQASHAITLAILVALVVRPESQTPLWILVMAPTLLPVVSAYLRRLLTGYLNFLGVNEEKWAGLSALGIGSALAVGKAGAGVLAAASAAPAAARVAGGLASRFLPGAGGGAAQAVGGGAGQAVGGGAAQAVGGGAAQAVGGAAATAGSLSGLGRSGGLAGGGAVPGTGLAGVPVPAWGGNRTGGNAVLIGAGGGGAGGPGPQIAGLQMIRSSSGLYVPAETGGQAAGSGGSSGVGPAGTGGQAAGSSGSSGAMQAGLPLRVVADVARFGLRTGGTVAAALIGAGMAAASGGGMGMVQEAAGLGTRVADAAWEAPGKVVTGGRELYQRLKVYNQQARGLYRRLQGRP